MLNESSVLCDSLIPFVQESSFAIDSGYSRSKIVFILCTESQQKSLRSVSVINEQLENYLRQIHSDLGKESINKIYVTGFKNVWAKAIVKSIFNIDATTVEEISAVFNGFDLISKHLKLTDLEFEIDEKSLNLDKYKIDLNNPMIAKFKNAMKVQCDKEITNEGAFNLPCILAVSGSTLKFYLIKKDKSIKLLNTIFRGGETMRGLSKCLIDSNNYGEFMAMANKGNRENIDTQVWEVMSENERSPYGKWPSQFPIFAYGKSADYDKGKEEFSPNDLMESLCNLMFTDINVQTIQLCKAYKLKFVYYCGGIFADSLFLKFVKQYTNFLPGNLELKIVKCDYILALGSMKKN